MAGESVRVWRPEGEDRVLLLAGRTTGYAVEPRGEYVFGVVAGAPMRSRRGSERRVVAPGRLVAWDPSAPHSGTAVDGRPWSSRLMIVEGADPGDDPLAGVTFPEPVLDDPPLIAGFLRVHAALEHPDMRLEGDTLLAEWLATVVARAARTRPRRAARSPGDDRALRIACDYLADHRMRNVGLEELAAVAGVSRFRLVRLFRDRTGLPPHAFQLAHRIRAARRLLEQGHGVADVAASTGFADQSHLHRHFRRSLGFTPAEYQRAHRAASRSITPPAPRLLAQPAVVSATRCSPATSSP